MNLVYRSENGMPYKLFWLHDWYEWTVPEEYFECRKYTMLEF